MLPGGSSPNVAIAEGFNPHPARKPDATKLFHAIRHFFLVSILTRPESRMLL